MKSIFGGGAIIATALLAGSLTFSARPLAAETLLINFQQQIQKAVQPGALGLSSSLLAEKAIEPAYEPEVPETPPSPYVATAYSLRGRTASGRPVARGLIAADPRVLPLGSRVRLEAGSLSGEYLVADTGGAVRGKRIDIWTPTAREAMRFGRRVVKLTVLSWGGKHSAAKKKG
jgi:3D (Asp-Asp-Asp) domain-containing protein